MRQNFLYCFYHEKSLGWSLMGHLNGGPGGVHNMLRVRVCAAHMGGFFAPNSLNKGPFFGRFPINKGGLSRN